ncbi:hypothetical protein A3C96_00185 [Candidatus Uhrbacteria bacterium RIFCSPHIGHO2_02_FULL_60_10]|uniref:O-antigen ligase-related domain-containing protein n=1 Tax=Candidatus Uhrbacteria bacterium RIFCSPHIGHO2_02_FULL_60_10 TaxID=1802392 RepID=A0A1F7U8B2_9BACT|nr:MAG: hypothetical protein A3C96_00185 [Candidatus Uhrbacteria bacterium RIFCSPHIGHO2_02_FULL_60_10]
MSSWLAKIGSTFGVNLNLHDRKGRDFGLFLGISALACGLLVAVFSPWKVLAVVLAVLVVGFGFYRPETILLLLALYTPLEPFLLKFVGDEIYIYARYFSEGLVYVILGSALLRLWMRRRPWPANPLNLPFAFFLVVAATSLLVNLVPPFIGILGLRQIIRFILLFFAVVILDPPRDFIKRFTSLLLLLFLAEGILGGVQAIVGAPLDELLIPSERRFYESIQLTTGTEQTWSPGTRVFATLGRYDQYGTFLSFFMLLVVGLIYCLRDKRDRRTLVMMLVAVMPAFVMTLSRASWFGFVLGLAAIGAWLKRDWRLRFGFLAAAVVIAAYLGVNSLVVRYMTDYPSQTPIERLFEAFSYERWRGEYYGLGRLYWMVQTPLVVVRSAPLFGVGPGQYGAGAAAALGNMRVYERLNLPFGVYGTEGYIDNNWFALWGETGTLGLIFYLWMFWALGIMSWRVWRKSEDPMTRGLALGFLGCLFAVTFQAFLATFLETRTLALYLWTYGAFVYVLGRREKIV